MHLPAIPEPFAHSMRARAADDDGVTGDRDGHQRGRHASAWPDGDTWLRGVGGRIERLLAQWSLQIDGVFSHGHCALVLPVRRKNERLALKVSWPHTEAEHEHLALRHWRGVGAVKLVAAEPGEWAMLLERCQPAHRLQEMSALDACEAIGALQARLAIPAPPQFDTASAWLARVAHRLTEDPPAMPRRFVSQGISLAHDLAGESGVDARLVHSDLHDGNVMQAARAGTVEGFVAIDPKPLAGTAALTVAPLLWNRWREATDAYNLRNHLRYRVDYACDPLGVAPEAARAWSIVRLLDNAWWSAHEARRMGSNAPDMTQEVAIIKAMQA